MRKKLLFFVALNLLMISCGREGDVDERTLNFPREVDYVTKLPGKDNFWIFILAGQSNMAGRGLVEPSDTVASQRIYSIDSLGNWIFAKEPLHFYEPVRTGLDCGLSFGRELKTRLGDSVFIGIVPCAIGGSSVEQWLGDSLYKGIKLYSNFREKAGLASEVGTIKGILWHQGETNAHENSFTDYEANLKALFIKFRTEAKNDTLQILVGELGPFLRRKEFDGYSDSVNNVLRILARDDPNISLIETGDLKHKGDSLHFNSESQRLLGKKFAEKLRIK